MVRAGNTCESYSNITRHALDIVGEGEQVGENALTVFIVGVHPTLGRDCKIMREIKLSLSNTFAVGTKVFVVFLPVILASEFGGCFAHIVGCGKPADERARIFHGEVEMLTESPLQTRGEPCIPESCSYRTCIEHVLNERETVSGGVVVPGFCPE